MLIFDQLKKNDPQLRAVSLVILCGMGILLAGLWWVQVVSAREYRESLETQSFRTVRIPAVRGKILDRDGSVLAENRPTYNISLYLEELRKKFDARYFQEVTLFRKQLEQQGAEQERKLNRRLTKQERKQFVVSTTNKLSLKQQARYEVASNVVRQVSLRLQQPMTLEATNFERHYETRLALPLPVLPDIDPTNIARFEEQLIDPIGVDLEIQSTRLYPQQTVAAHLVGWLKRDDSSVEGEEAFFSYRLPDFKGVVGVEAGYDRELRGKAGDKSVQVNNIGYRTTQNVWSSAEPGKNVVLTIDLEIQKAAEKALQSVYGPGTRGAVVVMDVRTGDILAMASSPTLNPNDSIRGYPPGELQRRRDEKLRPEFNRATQGNYFPGSIFKIVVGLAALEAGLNPEELITVAPNPQNPHLGVIYVGPAHQRFKDLAQPGDYNFKRALYKSSNAYFITTALRIGPERIVRVGQKFHLGERIGLSTRQETGGFLPSLKRVTSGWTEANTANMSIGQDPVTVTPLQVAVLISAIANGGKVLYPRLVARIEPEDPTSLEQPIIFPAGRVHDELGVSQRSLRIVQEAMLDDTEASDGTGVLAARECPGLRICGKTGTAQIQDVKNEIIGHTTWFASFAPYGDPRWAIVVMVEDGVSGGQTCSPVGGKIYKAILEREQRRGAKTGTLATTP
jgi:penicillin-binding protein 2